VAEQPTDRIRLTGISATGHHGVFEHERRDGQRFVADVVLHLDTRQAAADDDLSRTVDYGALAIEVHDVLTGAPADLVETVAERVAAVALAHVAVVAVDVVLHKPDAPIGVPFLDVAVEVHRSRSHLPVVDAAARAAAADEPPQSEPYPEPYPSVESYSAVEQDPSVEPHPAVEPYAAEALPAATRALESWESLLTAPADEQLVGEREASELALPLLTPGVAAPLAVGAAGTAAGAPAVGPPTAALPLVEVPWAADDVLSPADRLHLDEPGDRLDEPPAAPVDVVLALGSNLGSSQDILRAAVHELGALPGFEVTKVAPLARTAAVGGPDQPDFLNTVVLGRTVLSPRALLRACQEIEAAFGRERHEHWGARTLDVDIVVFGSTLAVADDLELPHPRAHQRAFVLEPWAQVAPDAVLPGLGGGPVAALATTAPDRDGIRWLALDWWAVPEE
jgi:dihydroneopterin aldolase/2-amino-4-hydroxy-6-hydroxymethyldihydropteridine diphosphokinase